MFPYSVYTNERTSLVSIIRERSYDSIQNLPWRHGNALSKNWLKLFRIPNHPETDTFCRVKKLVLIWMDCSSVDLHLFPPFELKLNKIRANSPINNGMEIIVNGSDFRSPSSLSANNTWYTKIGITVSEFPIAELIAVRRWACDTSGVRNKIPQNITLYSTPVSSDTFWAYYFDIQKTIILKMVWTYQLNLNITQSRVARKPLPNSMWPNRLVSMVGIQIAMHLLPWTTPIRMNDRVWRTKRMHQH